MRAPRIANSLPPKGKKARSPVVAPAPRIVVKIMDPQALHPTPRSARNDPITPLPAAFAARALSETIAKTKAVCTPASIVDAMRKTNVKVDVFKNGVAHPKKKNATRSPSVHEGFVKISPRREKLRSHDAMAQMTLAPSTKAITPRGR